MKIFLRFLVVLSICLGSFASAQSLSSASTSSFTFQHPRDQIALQLGAIQMGYTVPFRIVSGNATIAQQAANALLMGRNALAATVAKPALKVQGVVNSPAVDTVEYRDQLYQAVEAVVTSPVIGTIKGSVLVVGSTKKVFVSAALTPPPSAYTIPVPFALEASNSVTSMDNENTDGDLRKLVDAVGDVVLALGGNPSKLLTDPDEKVASIEKQTKDFLEMRNEFRIPVLSGNMAFGEVSIGNQIQKNLTIFNKGFADLIVSGIHYPPGFSGNWSGVIGPRQTQDIAVIFTPSEVGIYTGEIKIDSNATGGNSSMSVSAKALARPDLYFMSYPWILGSIYSPINHQITTSLTNVTFSSSDLPQGLSLNSTTGIITGSFSQIGVHEFSVTAQSSLGDNATQRITLNNSPTGHYYVNSSEWGTVINYDNMWIPADGGNRHFGEFVYSFLGIGGIPLPANVSISSQPPISQNVSKGSTVTLAVEPQANFSWDFEGQSGNTQMVYSYQWKRNDIPLNGKINKNLILTNISENDSGNYSVEIYHFGTTTYSGPFKIVISPKIVSQPPATLNVKSGETLKLEVNSEGSNLGYQWRWNGINLVDQTSPVLEIPNIHPSQAGSYKCHIANDAGSVSTVTCIVSITNQ
jgi:hypothetical protein